MEFHSVELSYSITDPGNLSIAALLKSIFKESIFARIRHRKSPFHFYYYLTITMLVHTDGHVCTVFADHLPVVWTALVQLRVCDFVRLEMAAFVTRFPI